MTRKEVFFFPILHENLLLMYMCWGGGLCKDRKHLVGIDSLPEACGSQD